MGAYRSTGDFDDTILDDGDRGFVGVNQRLQVNQLEAGEVRESMNGRMEGYWQPRKGVVNRTESLVTGESPLQLPFLLTDSGKVITGASVPSVGVLRITITGHGFPIGEQGYAIISNMDAAVNGRRFFTVTGVDTMECPVIGLTSVVDVTGNLTTVPLNDSANSAVRASCLFSDPNSDSRQFVIIALDSTAKKVDLRTYAAEDIPYPSGEVLASESNLLQVFSEVYLFRGGQRALEWFPNGRTITSASQVGTVVTAKVRRHGLKVGSSLVISGLTGGTPANGTFVVTGIIDVDTFSYTFATSQTVTFTVTSALMKSGFTYAPAGAYVQPQTFSASSSGVSVTSGIVSITVTGNTTIVKGDTVRIYSCDIPLLSAFVGQEFTVTEATTTLIRFFAPVANITAGGSNKIEVGGQFSIGGGYIHQPAAPWGTYFQRRLWVPFYYQPEGTFAIPTYSDRGIKDEIAVSDIMDNNTFDQIENQFRISGGIADSVVAMHGFYDDGLVVLNRNSLHLVSGTQGSLKDTVVKELTSEVGCLARRSVVVRGNAMLFLSDDGVFGLEFLDNYNLRGTEQPLSVNIQPYIDRLNRSLVTDAVGVLYNNRYYLAVPLDSLAGSNDARGNNAVLIYNFLNKGWESVDTFGVIDFLIKDFIVGSAYSRNNLYVVTQNGGLHELEANTSSNDLIFDSGTQKTAGIQSRLTTRGYDFNTMDRKRFSDAQVSVQAGTSEQAEYDISFSAEDPDRMESIGTTTQFLGGEIIAPNAQGEAETANVRFRLAGLRGNSGTLSLTRTVGSPKINAIRISGTIANRSVISQK